MSTWHQMVELALSPLDKSKAGSAEMTYVVSYLLDQSGVSHHCRSGYVRCAETGEVILGHCWVELEDGWVVDLTIGRCFGFDPTYPHGVFELDEYPDMEFQGLPFFPIELDREMLDAMSDFVLDDIMLPGWSEAA